MKTTVTEFKYTNCPRCAGAGKISSFQHFKCGTCFTCGGTGKAPPVAVERTMTDDEILMALDSAGFPVVFADRPDTGNYLTDLFMSADELAAHAITMQGARMMLAALR